MLFLALEMCLGPWFTSPEESEEEEEVLDTGTD